MPNQVVVEEGVKCSYFSICDIEDVVVASRALPQPSGLVNAYVNVSTLSRYQSLTNDEQHFHPSSLTFELTCLFDGGHIQVSHLGLQRKVIEFCVFRMSKVIIKSFFSPSGFARITMWRSHGTGGSRKTVPVVSDCSVDRRRNDH